VSKRHLPHCYHFAHHVCIASSCHKCVLSCHEVTFSLWDFPPLAVPPPCMLSSILLREKRHQMASQCETEQSWIYHYMQHTHQTFLFQINTTAPSDHHMLKCWRYLHATHTVCFWHYHYLWFATCRLGFDLALCDAFWLLSKSSERTGRDTMGCLEIVFDLKLAVWWHNKIYSWWIYLSSKLLSV
jgi:hypothetical protein